MSPRLIQAALLLTVAACSAAPSQSSAAATDKPFNVTEVTRFNAPWAMTFLPGSGFR